MKKFLSLICLVVLVLVISSVTLAAGSIGVDFMPGGIDHIDKDSDDQNGRFNSSFITLEGTIKDFKYGIEYGNGTSKFKDGDILADSTYDFNSMEYKIGVRFLNIERVKLDAVVSSLQLQLKTSGIKVDENGYLLGCDANVNITEKVSLEGYVGVSIFGATYKENGIDYDPAFLSAAKVRFNYAVSENVLLSLGFRTILCHVSDYDNNSKEELNRGISGFSIGCKYSF